MIIGRAAIVYPWIFNEIKHYFETGENYPTYDFRPTFAVKNNRRMECRMERRKISLIEIDNITAIISVEYHILKNSKPSFYKF
jgi:tRNA-dihydrouridine synthase